MKLINEFCNNIADLFFAMVQRNVMKNKAWLLRYFSARFLNAFINVFVTFMNIM